MFNERRSKHNQERRQRALRAQQQAAAGASSSAPPSSPPVQHSSSSSSSSARQSSEPVSSQGTPSNSHHPSNSSSTDDAADQAEEVEYHSPESDTASAQYTPRAAAYPPPHFPIPTRGMFERFDRLQRRQFANTRRLDFEALHAFGVYVPFVQLTERIGFTPAFWGIQHDCYQELSLEFLSSLKLRWDPEDQPYIKFQMRGETRRVGIVHLREWFGFKPNPETHSLDFRVGMDKEHFWRLLTGMECADSNQYRGLAIPHPVLRCIQRALANTIFARGETVARANEEDLQLLDHMLRPEAELEKPDLMLFMVRHWLSVQRNKKKGGSIHIGAYVTLIAERLGVSLAGLHLSTGPILMDARAYQSATFIKIERGPANHPDRYFWRLQDGTQHLLPAHAPLSFDDERTDRKSTV